MIRRKSKKKSKADQQQPPRVGMEEEMEGFFIVMGMIATVAFFLIFITLVAIVSDSHLIEAKTWKCTSFSVENQRCIKYEKAAQP